MIKSLQDLFRLLTKKERNTFILMFFFMLIAATLETLSIAAVIPFIRYILDIGNLEVLSSYNFLNDRLIIIYFLLVILIVFLLKNIFLIYFKYWYTKKINFLKVRIGTSLFKSYLNRDYNFHLKHNSSELIRNNSNEVNLFSKTIFLIVIILTETLISLGLFLMVFYVTPLGFMVASIIFISTAIIFYHFFKTQFFIMGKQRLSESNSAIRKLLEAFSSIKEIIHYNAKNIFIDQFNKHNSSLARLSTRVTFINYLPALILEYLGIITFIIIFLILFYFQNMPMEEIFFILSLFVLAALKIMPSVSKILVALQSFKNNSPALNIIYNELKDDHRNNLVINDAKTNIVSFDKKIVFKNISFTFDGRAMPVLKNLNFTIKKGESIGIVGKSGKGKSTLANILLGLLKPTSGEIIIDDKLIKHPFFWGNQIGVVSQSVYLIDESIKENIAFGINLNSINLQKVESATKISQISDFIKTLPNGLMTIVGERGVQLSGGQLQRLGIARAMYHNPKLLIFDEATSQLDKETEKRLIDLIYSFKKNKTIIIITHNLSILDKCDKIINLNDY